MTWLVAFGISQMRRNGIQHHAPPDDPDSFISLLSLFYYIIWLDYMCKLYICLQISAH